MPTPKQHTTDFTPPFCPNPNCHYHNRLKQNWPFKKAGFFHRLNQPQRIQRFTCLHCRRSFSSQTFSTTYWQKLPGLDMVLFTKATACMANRQINRDLHVTPETINRHLGRLARQCMLFHIKMMQDADPAQHIAIDGFVSFELSQYFPFHHHLAVEKGTDFFLYFTDSEVRRSGTMKREQKERRRQLEAIHGKPDPQAVRKDVREMLQVVIGGQSEVWIDSDDHRAYPSAIKGLAPRIHHRVTSSREHRGSGNPLWEVNLLDLIIRHSSANHKRETIAWSKRRQCSSERLAIFLVWRNYMQGRREKSRGSPTPAMARGMCSRRLTPEDILKERIFVSQLQLPKRWQQYYERLVQTRALGRQRRHELKYAA